jgi:peptide/nickel transport system ATP-binding protein
MTGSNHLLDVQNIKVTFKGNDGEVTALENVSFHINKGEILGVVGESGCGKSVTSLSIMRLLGQKGRIAEGEISFNGKALTSLSEYEMQKIRGNEISMIFQEPMTSLNPVFTLGNQMIETIRLHLKLNKKESRKLAIEMLKKVGIPRAETIIDDYPHALSGGMRQRVMIAMALVCQPSLLIADEPTTALDVTIQAQILDLMKMLIQDSEASIMLITHDLGVIAEMADRVVVMYAGQIIEEADVFTLFDNPKHPYTQGLLRSIPHMEGDGVARLESIPGSVPSLQSMPKGCRFSTRCPYVTEKCLAESPDLHTISRGHSARCWLLTEDKAGQVTESQQVFI